MRKQLFTIFRKTRGTKERGTKETFHQEIVENLEEMSLSIGSDCSIIVSLPHIYHKLKY